MASRRELRKTRFTDAQGRPRVEHNEVFELSHLDRLAATGVPEHWLRPEGAAHPIGTPAWEASGDLTGALADGILALGLLMQGIDDRNGLEKRRNASRVAQVIEAMAFLLRKAGVEPFNREPPLIPLDVFELRLRQYEVNGWKLPKDIAADLERAREASRLELVAAYDAGMLEMGMPAEMLTPEHDHHGHSKGPHGWRCTREGS